MTGTERVPSPRYLGVRWERRDAAAWRTGTTPAERMASFDKQIVRDWLAAHWDKTGTPPELPAEIVGRTADRYRELLELLTS